MAVINTGVMLSTNDLETALELEKGIYRGPLIGRNIQAILERSAAAEQALFSWINATAVAYGLPEPKKDQDGDVINYGLSMTGEFTRWEEDQ